jgi:hypothetical protein
MVSFTGIPAVAIIALGALIQPTLAGPAAGIARAGLSVVGSLGGSGSNNHKRDTSITEAQIDTLFGPCYKSSEKNPPTIHYDTPTKSGAISNLSKECMSAFETYLAEINPQHFGHAAIKITGPNSVHVENIPPQFVAELEKHFKGPAAPAVPTTAPPAKQEG